MGAATEEPVRRAPNVKTVRLAGPRADANTFFIFQFKKPNTDAREWRRVFKLLVDRVIASPMTASYAAVEAGVPTYLVNVIAGTMGEPIAAVMDLIGVSETTFRRKEEAREPLPEAAGHRVMGFLRVIATLRKLLDESGDPEQLKDFDLEAWVARWVREELPELGGNTPAQMLRNPEGQRAVEQVLERMRGGLVA